jgi:hypothetical protein
LSSEQARIHATTGTAPMATRGRLVSARPMAQVRRALPAFAGSAAPDFLGLQAAAGNRAVMALVQRQKPPDPAAEPKRRQKGKARPKGGAKEAGAGKAGVGGKGTTSGFPSSAESDRATAAALAPATVEFPWFEASTYNQLASGFRLLFLQMKDDTADLPASDAWNDADEWITDMGPWIEWLQTFGEKKIQAGAAKLAEGKLADYQRIAGEVYEERAWPLRKAYYQAQVAAEKAAEETEKTEGQIADAMRAAYRSGNTGKIKNVLSIVKSTVSLGRNLRRLGNGFAEEILNLKVPKSSIKIRIPTGDPMGRAPMSRPLGDIKLEITNVNKYLEKIDLLARGFAALNLGLTIIGRKDKKMTAPEQGMKDITDAVSAFSDIGTLLGGLPPHISLITTSYIGPALKVISAQIGRLVDDVHEENKVAVEATGDVWNVNAEPGRQPMLDFMSSMKRARTEADAPVVEGEVQDYLWDHRKMLSAGVEYDDIPVDDSGWSDKLDRAGARRWVYRNRDRVWQMLYGSMSVPRR